MLEPLNADILTLHEVADSSLSLMRARNVEIGSIQDVNRNNRCRDQKGKHYSHESSITTRSYFREGNKDGRVIFPGYESVQGNYLQPHPDLRMERYTANLKRLPLTQRHQLCHITRRRRALGIYYPISVQL